MTDIGSVWTAYGTAWKGERTGELVKQAIACGFRAFDLAAQPQHYREDLALQAIKDAIDAEIVPRRELWIASKFTPENSQDPDTLPYCSGVSIKHQVHQSIERTLAYFNLDSEGAYLDCLFLHAPLPTFSETMDGWSAMSEYVPARIRKLGISNITIGKLETICAVAQVKPSVVQNPFCERNDFDVQVRAFCKQRGLQYQGFWILTGSPIVLDTVPVQSLASQLNISREQALYLLAANANVIVLNGTRDEQRMKADLASMNTFTSWRAASQHSSTWAALWDQFESMIN